MNAVIRRLTAQERGDKVAAGRGVAKSLHPLGGGKF
jgi:hypothetical protein